MDVYQRRRLVALSSVVGVFVIVVLAVASGGDDETPEPTAVTGVTGATGAQGAQSLGKQEYIDQADSSCEEANVSLEQIDQSDPAAAAQRETEVMSNLLQVLRALPPPDRQEDLAESFLDSLNDQVEILRSRELAIERDQADTLVELDTELAEMETEAQAAADEFGFEVCGNPDAEVDPGVEGTAEPVDPGIPAEPPPEEVVPVDPPAEEPPPDDGSGGVTPEEEGSGGVSP